MYYSINEEASFGLDSSEKRVQFVGIAEHVGHAMTFKILSEDTLKIIYHSCVHAATEPASANLSAECVCTGGTHMDGGVVPTVIGFSPQYC